MLYLSRRIYDHYARFARDAVQSARRRDAAPDFRADGRGRDLRLRDPRGAAPAPADRFAPPGVLAARGPRRHAARRALDPLSSRAPRQYGAADADRYRDAHARPRERDSERCGSPRAADGLLFEEGDRAARARVLR